MLRVLITFQIMLPIAYGFLTFGAYKLSLEQVSVLKTDAEMVDFKVLVKKPTKKDTVLAANLTFKEDVGPISVKNKLYEWKNGGWKRYSSGKIKLLEDNFCLLLQGKDASPLLEMDLRLTSPPGCKFEKGTWSVDNVDADRAAHKVNNSFLFGRFKWIITYLANDKALFTAQAVFKSVKKQ